MNPITITGYRESTQTANKVNIRQSASTSASIVGTLPAYPTVTTGYVADSEPVFANGYSWQFYELSIEDKTVSGYMATEFVKEVSEPAPDAKLFYDIEGATFHMTQSEWDTFCVNVATVAAILPTVQGRE